MHAPTIIVVLSLHLICFGGLCYVIGRRLPPGNGLNDWGTGSMMFGFAYVGRGLTGNDVVHPWVAGLDTAMVGASLLWAVGLMRFVGRNHVPRRALVIGSTAFALLDVAALDAGGAVARFTLLNAALGLTYGATAALALGRVRHQSETERTPLVITGVLVLALALLTLGRGYWIARVGVGAVFEGAFAQVFYGYASITSILLPLIVLWMTFSRLNMRLALLAVRDPLTQALNRNGLEEVLRRHFAARDPSPMVVLQMDVDHFKRINDRWGHAAGDDALRAIAENLSLRVRGDDFVARIGGEEFVIGYAGAEEEVARALAERLRAGIENLEIPMPDGSVLRCTASFGISRPLRSLTDWPEAAREADRALYAAKAAGRNCVMRASEALPAPTAVPVLS